MAHSDPVGSLMRGIDIVKLIGNAKNGLTISEIASLMGLKQPTSYNLIRTLLLSGFVEKRNKRLFLGQELIQLTKKGAGNALLAAAEPELLNLYQNLPRGTVVLAVPGPDSMLQTHRIAFDRPGVIQHLNFEPMHLYACEAGLVYLAYLSGETEKIRVNERWPFAEFGIHLWKSRENLNQHLNEIRRTGFAVLPFDRDISCRIAAPILNGSGKLIAAVGASIPVQNLRGSDLTAIQKAILDSAARLAAVLK